jgi:AhpD family alkylhydroperoxidase
MENKTKMLIAVAASYTANCQPCLETAIEEAQKMGVDKKEIFEAIAIGRVVRKGAMGKMDKFASTATGKELAGTSEKCPLGTTDEEVKDWVQQDDQCDCTKT